MSQRGVSGKISQLVLAVALTSAVSLVGCGSNEDRVATARVTGKVVFGGNPVTGGQLVFSPVAKNPGKPFVGKSGYADIKPNGTFEVSTYTRGDGAVVGEHQVAYLAPPVETGPHGEAKGENKFGNLKVATETATVKAGSNELTIELIAVEKLEQETNKPE